MRKLLLLFVLISYSFGIVFTYYQIDLHNCETGSHGAPIPVKTVVIGENKIFQEEQYHVGDTPYSYYRSPCNSHLTVCYCPKHPNRAFTSDDKVAAPYRTLAAAVLTLIIGGSAAVMMPPVQRRGYY